MISEKKIKQAVRLLVEKAPIDRKSVERLIKAVRNWAQKQWDTL